METEINKLFDDKVLNELDPNLTLLPDDLKRDIFEKYFYPNTDLGVLIMKVKLCCFHAQFIVTK